jgi:predicted Rossmann fold nucleotide-binding protein DprA/Smf involved in DNA uptake
LYIDGVDYDASVALITLAELPRVGERRLQRVQREARGRGMPLARVLALDGAALAREYGLPAPALARLERDRFWHTAHCRALVARLAACGACICQPGEADYPSGWSTRAHPAPPVAYLFGACAVLAQPAIALLSSRGVSEQTVMATMHVARSAAQEGLALAVGGMKSTHRIAAATARAAGTPRLVVLDRGLLAAFGGQPEFDPFGFGPGRTRFDPRATLVLSVFRPLDHATPRSGRRRDELIAALGDIVVALSARPGGEVERICLRARDLGQVVLSWHGDNRALLAAGAVPIDERDLQRGLGRLLPHGPGAP